MRTDTAIEKFIELAPVLDDLTDKMKKSDDYKTLMFSLKGASNSKVLFKILPLLLKNYDKEVYEIIAIMTDKSEDEIKAQGIGATINDVKIIFDDKDFMSFFSLSTPTQEAAAE